MNRSYLFAPGHNDKLLRKVFDAGADAVILDLEDAVPPHEKDTARASVADALARRSAWVRINAPLNPRCRKRSRGSGSAGLRYPNPEGRISGRRPLGRRARAGQTAALCDRNRERRRQRPPDRYWSVEVADSYTNNLFYIGTRATGGKGGNHAFVGPNWKGTLPPGVVEHRVPTDSVMFAIRIGVLPGDAADLAKVNALQEQFTLTSLDNWADPAKHGQAAAPDLGPRTPP